jgi:hypothetical protein
VAGAAIVFSLPSQGASATFANNSTILNLVTNHAGKAFASGLKANNIAGTFRITVTASFQGQTASAVMMQTNVIAGAAAGTGAAGGTGAGTGGGTAGTAGGGTAAGAGGGAAGAAGAGAAGAGTAAAGTAAAGVGAAAGISGVTIGAIAVGAAAAVGVAAKVATSSGSNDNKNILPTLTTGTIGSPGAPVFGPGFSVAQSSFGSLLRSLKADSAVPGPRRVATFANANASSKDISPFQRNGLNSETFPLSQFNAQFALIRRVAPPASVGITVAAGRIPILGRVGAALNSNILPRSVLDQIALRPVVRFATIHISMEQPRRSGNNRGMLIHPSAH